jgi:hypothetical protein
MKVGKDFTARGSKKNKKGKGLMKKGRQIEKTGYEKVKRILKISCHKVVNGFA